MGRPRSRAAVGVAGEVDAGSVSSVTDHCSSITCVLNSESSYVKVRKLAGLRGHLGKGFMNAPRRDMQFTGDLAD